MIKETVPISVVIPTWNRTDQLLSTLERIASCTPSPAEILVHVDAGDTTSVAAVQSTFPGVGILKSASRTGAVGGRRKLMQRASNELVVGFDDDSWPMDEDFFGEVIRLFDGFSPKCALVACQIIHRGESIPPRVGTLGRAASFVGCGAVFRRSAILDIGGYTPVVYGHGFEETDLALRLWDSDHVIMGTDQLRVFHDTDLSHHVSPAVNGAQITNLALVALLRYPLSMQWYGAFQILNRVFYSMRMGRFGGILHGLGKIPSEFWRLRQCRIPVNARTVWRFRELMSRGQRL